MVRPNPFPDESLLGYVIRLTECNGYETANDLISLLPNLANYFSYRKNLRISNLHGASSSLFYNLAKLIQKDPQTIFNLIKLPFEEEKIKPSSVLQNHNAAFPYTYKFCALCLKEKPYHRKIWDLMIITACPIHKCLLSYSCPQCKKPLRKSQKSICKCRCEFDFRKIKPTFIPDDEAKLVEYIHFLAGIWKTKSVTLSLNNPLNNYPLEGFCNTIYYYTKRIFRLNSAERFTYSKLTAQDNFHELVFKAFTIFDDFPNNYLAYIEELIQNPNYLKNRNWFNYFAANYNEFKRIIPDSLRALLYKTFNKHIDKILFRNNKKISQANFPSLISDSELANQLGLQAEEIINLVSAGEITAIGQPLRRGTLYLFDGDTFYRIIKKVRSNKKSFPNQKATTLMNLNQISQYLSNSNLKLHQFLSLVLQGEIKSCFEDLSAKGLHRFLFDKKDVMKFKKYYKSN